MTDDLLDLARIESGHLAVDPIDTDLRDIIEQAAQANATVLLRAPAPGHRS